jgi:bifunctional non-homologous end joining protein LigD
MGSRLFGRGWHLGLRWLHSRKRDDEVQFYAFDMLMSDEDDLRQLLRRRVDGIILNDFE